MGQADFWNDTGKAQATVAQLKTLNTLLKPLEESLAVGRDLEALEELAREDISLEGELKQEADRLEKLVDSLELASLLSGPHDSSDALVSIHARDGGTDANDWAEMMLRMYSAWAGKHDYTIELLDRQDDDVAGIQSATVAIRGPWAYGYLKGEMGIHRLVRISPFNSEGKRQTSFAAVDVSPEIADDDTEVEIRDEDIREDVFRASGAGGLRGRPRGLPAQKGVEEAVEVAVEHALEVAHIVPRSLVFDPLVGVQKVVADLRTKPGLGLLLVASQLIGLPLLFLETGDPGPQHLDCRGPILVLAPLALTLHHDPGRKVGEPDGTGGLVDVLAAGTAGPEDVLADVLVAEFHLRVVVGDFGRDVDRGKARLPLPFGIERTDPDQPMDAHLSFEIAVGPRASNRDRGTLNARHRVILAIEQFDGVVVLAGPGRVHPQHHLGPIIGIGAAVPGMDRDERVARIVRTGEERREFQTIDELFKPAGLLGKLALQRDVLAGEFFHGFEVAADAQRLFEWLEQRVEGFQLCDGGLCLAGVVPEVCLAHRVFQPGRRCLASLPVKGSPAAAAVGPGWFRRG
jgi:hypothetical protein